MGARTTGDRLGGLAGEGYVVRHGSFGKLGTGLRRTPERLTTDGCDLGRRVREGATRRGCAILDVHVLNIRKVNRGILAFRQSL